MKSHLIPEPIPLILEPAIQCRPSLVPHMEEQREQPLSCLRPPDEKAPITDMPIRNFLRVVFVR